MRLKPGSGVKETTLVRAFIRAAMEHAHYEPIDQPKDNFYGEIPGLDGVMAGGGTLEECRDNLEDALDAWLVLGLQLGHVIPEIDGIELERLKVAGEWRDSPPSATVN